MCFCKSKENRFVDSAKDVTHDEICLRVTRQHDSYQKGTVTLYAGSRTPFLCSEESGL